MGTASPALPYLQPMLRVEGGEKERTWLRLGLTGEEAILLLFLCRELCYNLTARMATRGEALIPDREGEIVLRRLWSTQQ